MAKYIPLALAIFLTAVGITVEHSIFNASVHTMSEHRWMSYGLEGFVFMLWSLGIFVIGATCQDFGKSGAERHIPAKEKEEKSWSYF